MNDSALVFIWIPMLPWQLWRLMQHVWHSPDLFMVYLFVFKVKLKVDRQQTWDLSVYRYELHQRWNKGWECMKVRGSRLWYGTGSTQKKITFTMWETAEFNYRVYNIWLLQILLEAISRHMRVKDLTGNRQHKLAIANHASPWWDGEMKLLAPWRIRRTDDVIYLAFSNLFSVF